MTSNFLSIKKNLPFLGVGLGLRRELAEQTITCPAGIDWLELVPENYMALGGRIKARLDAARAKYPLVTHGVNLSIGSTDDLCFDYLQKLANLLNYIDAPWWSDHFCFTSAGGAYMHDLLPVPLNLTAAKHMARRAKEAQSIVGRPLLLENISYYMDMPGKSMDEADFISEVLERADIGLLLDVNNIYVNAINHNFDPYKYLDRLPLERVVQVHIAGHSHGEEMIIDTHGAPVIEPVFELLDYLLTHTTVHAVMLERDQNYPEFKEILAELDQIRKICEKQPVLAKTAQAEAIA
ncbi:MAG: DUF692 domain-containing protein [Candidatus Obscuribacter sp.]|jgi:uncharacterized protein (UPF0276 family)|nr:DUF692 domain-containing protein [Candidatus Obscuribacter sp.]MBP6591886.1 DUF692 domain-containing protein [Candidatus Obscuribacter sp.]MDQ5964499.1 hypothetical protein [Cyanobacteriota bacterium erpe_2018_sw_39hr_WHONDRS-SW48-000098_B_bin.30]